MSVDLSDYLTPDRDPQRVDALRDRMERLLEQWQAVGEHHNAGWLRVGWKKDPCQAIVSYLPTPAAERRFGRLVDAHCYEDTLEYTVVNDFADLFSRVDIAVASERLRAYGPRGPDAGA